MEGAIGTAMAGGRTFGCDASCAAGTEDDAEAPSSDGLCAGVASESGVEGRDLGERPRANRVASQRRLMRSRSRAQRGLTVMTAGGRARGDAERKIQCHKTSHLRGKKRNEFRAVDLAPPIGVCALSASEDCNSSFPGSKIATAPTVALLQSLVNAYLIARWRRLWSCTASRSRFGSTYRDCRQGLGRGYARS